MGYNTEYKGIMYFTCELSNLELAYLNKHLGEDIRDHRDWDTQEMEKAHAYHINLKLTEHFDGLKWDGSEKTYGMAESLQLITKEMKKVKPEFGIKGEFLCQGEDIDDRYFIVAEGGKIYETKCGIDIGKIIKCPKCGHTFEDQEGICH